MKNINNFIYYNVWSGAKEPDAKEHRGKVCSEGQQQKKRIETAQVREGIKRPSGIYSEHGGYESHDIGQGLQLKRS